jgi:hypothetical protein
MTKASATVLLAFTLSFPFVARAQGEFPEQTGFTGMLRVGVGYITSPAQLNARDENKRVADLGGDADWYDTVIPVVLFDLRYVFEGRRAAAYARTPFGSGGPPGLAVGTVQPLPDRGEVDASLWLNPFGDVWEDPYLAGVKRDETSKLEYGIKIAYDDVWGTDLEISYSYGRVEVDNDAIGARFGALERDGESHKLAVGYELPGPYGVMVIPTAEYSRGDLDGQANSFNGYGLKIALRKFSEVYAVNVFLNGVYEDYDKGHPVFEKTREDWKLGGFGLLTFPNLLGVESVLGDLIAGYSYRDSNIDFLDAKTFIGGVMLGYEF